VSNHIAPTGTERLLRPEQAAELLGYTVRALEAWRAQGRGPRYVRVSARSVRYRPSDVAAWAEERVRTSIADERDQSPTRPLALAGDARRRHALLQIRTRAEAAIDGPPVDPGWLLDVVADALGDEEAGT